MFHISVIGLGCVGSVISERLWTISENIIISAIAEGERGEKLEKNGITVNENTYYLSNTRNVNYPVDLIIVCVKNYQLEQACLDLAPFVSQNTIILPLLNSVTPTPTIQSILKNNNVLYGYISKIDSYRDNNGFRYNIAGDIHFGYAENKNPDKKLLYIEKLLNSAGFHAFIDEDMKHGIWKKWMLNVGANQVSALTEANYIQFARIKEIEHVLRLAMQELLMIACYEKVNLSTQDIMDLLDYLTTYPYPKETSMLQDIKAHRRTEIDYISGDIIKLSHKWNCPCPVNLTMYYLIKSKEKCYLDQ